MKYYLKILHRANKNGKDHIFVVDKDGKEIPRQICHQWGEDLDSIYIKMQSHHDPPELHENGEEAARIYWTFEGHINGEDRIEDIPFRLVNKTYDPVFEK